MTRKFQFSENTLSIFGEVVEAVLEITRATNAALILRSDEGWEVKAQRSRTGDTELELSTTVVEDTFRTGEATFVRDAASDKALSTRESINDLQIRTILCVPVTLEAQVVGVLYASNRGLVNRFDEGTLAEFATFASEVGHFLQGREATRT
jgi:GAF domain-containing protein